MARKATMEFGEAVRIATASLWAHKLRSVLTLLGVVIGVTSVIAVVSFINGLNSYVAGARQRNILWQFLLEATTLAGVGGLLGVAFGSGLGLLVRLVFPSLPATPSIFWASAGLLTSALIGVSFGVYPAWKAARLNPVEALRYE